jgi:3-dehydrosphinganine reductase
MKYTTAFITGGSSGIGFELARMLVMDGSSVTILGRRKELLAEAVQKLGDYRVNPNQVILSSQADVSDEKKLFPILEKYQAENGVPELLINSAGVTRPGKFQTLPIGSFREIMEINYLGTVHVTRAFIDGMLKRKSGSIVNISSMAGYLGVYGYSGYCGSKFAVRGFSDVLRAEMKPHGIRVSIVYPPDTLTPQLEWEAQYKPAITKELTGTAGVQTAEKVARIILRDISRGRYTIFPGFEAWLYYQLTSLLGDLTFPVMDMQIRSAIKAIIKRRKII